MAQTTLFVEVILLALLCPYSVLASPSRAATGVSGDGTRSLLTAAAQGENEKVQRLLASGVPVDARSPNGFTALIVASDANQPTVVKTLLDHGAQVNAVLPPADGPFGGCTALVFAASGGGQAYIDPILNPIGMPAPPSHYEGHEAAFAKRYPDQMRQWEQKVQTWENGYDEICRMLIAHGADVNACSRQGVTPLIAACAVRSFATVKMLIAAGADVTAETCNVPGELSLARITALSGAVRQRNSAMVQLLLDHGAEVSVYQEGDETPLGEAADEGDVQIVQILLNHGARVNDYDDLGRTALMYAKRAGHRDVIAVLVSAGAKSLRRAPHAWVDFSEILAPKGKANKTPKGPASAIRH